MKAGGVLEWPGGCFVRAHMRLDLHHPYNIERPTALRYLPTLCWSPHYSKFNANSNRPVNDGLTTSLKQDLTVELFSHSNEFFCESIAG